MSRGGSWSVSREGRTVPPPILNSAPGASHVVAAQKQDADRLERLPDPPGDSRCGPPLRLEIVDRTCPNRSGRCELCDRPAKYGARRTALCGGYQRVRACRRGECRKQHCVSGVCFTVPNKRSWPHKISSPTLPGTNKNPILRRWHPKRLRKRGWRRSGATGAHHRRAPQAFRGGSGARLGDHLGRSPRGLGPGPDQWRQARFDPTRGRSTKCQFRVTAPALSRSPAPSLCCATCGIWGGAFADPQKGPVHRGPLWRHSDWNEGCRSTFSGRALRRDAG